MSAPKVTLVAPAGTVGTIDGGPGQGYTIGADGTVDVDPSVVPKLLGDGFFFAQVGKGSKFSQIGLVYIGDSITQGYMSTAQGSVTGAPAGSEVIGYYGFAAPNDHHWTGTADAGYMRADNAIAATAFSWPGPGSNDARAGAPTAGQGSHTSWVPMLLRLGNPLSFARSLTANLGVNGSSVHTWTGNEAAVFVKFISNPNDGDTLTIDAITYTFRTSPFVAYDVLIGANLTATSVNLANAINLEGTGYAVATLRHPTAFAPDPIVSGHISVYYWQPGTLGNSAPVATASAGRLDVIDPSTLAHTTTMAYGSAAGLYEPNVALITPAFGTVNAVVIGLGTNDSLIPGLRGRGTQTQMGVLLAKVAASFPSAKIVVVLPPPSGAGGLTASTLSTIVVPAITAAVAAVPGVTLVDPFTMGLGSGNSAVVSNDQTHPSLYGFSLRAQLTARGIAAALGL